ncbi:uncharacterized protein K441DRAFT_577748, partial [Cenococcum geophilum 1.58]|uniref:uncharacterized protein n=1 Tax=Cenococcum geophilum 1.58 TaxID=794803 RepID=UPI00358EC117
VNNLGLLYADQGKLGKQALEGKEKVLRRDYILILSIVNNLGLLYADQGKLGKVEKIYQRALEGKEKALR